MVWGLRTFVFMYRISAKRCIDNRIGAHYNPHKDGCIDGGAGDCALAADSQKSSADAARDSKAATEAKLVECRDILFVNAIVTQDDALVRSMRHRMRANKRDTENAATECNLELTATSSSSLTLDAHSGAAASSSG